MKTLKLALILCAAALAACSNAPNANNETAHTGNAAPPASTTTPRAAASATPDQFAEARATYNTACVRCHKENGEGGLVELDEKTKVKVPSLREGHALKHDEAAFARQIANGGEGMPAFKKRLSQEQIDQLARFIRQDMQRGLVQDNAANPAPDAHK